MNDEIANFNWRRLLITTSLVVVGSVLTSSITWILLSNMFLEGQSAYSVLIKQLEQQISRQEEKYKADCVPKEGVAKDNGSISGDLTYPSEGIPTTMKVYAITIDGSKTYDAKITGTKYTVDVPAGEYYVYGTVNDTDKAFYNKFITCGMSVTCTDMTKIPVTVVSGKATTNIMVGDFWNPEK